MALIAAHLNAGIILVVMCSDRYIISFSPHLHTPFSPSLISRTVSVDVKHHVYLLTPSLLSPAPPCSKMFVVCRGQKRNKGFTHLKPVVGVVVFDGEHMVVDGEEVAVGSHEVSQVQGLHCNTTRFYVSYW